MFLSHSLLALSPADVLPAVYLCTNKIAADHENVVGLFPVVTFTSLTLMRIKLKLE